MGSPMPDWPKGLKAVPRKTAAQLRALATSLPNVQASMYAHAITLSDLAKNNPSMRALAHKVNETMGAAVERDASRSVLTNAHRPIPVSGTSYLLDKRL